MSAKRYAEEFKIEAVKQVTERGPSGFFANDNESTIADRFRVLIRVQIAIL